MRKNVFFISLTILFWLPGLHLQISAQDKNPQAALDIKFDSAANTYDRMIFGQFIEHFHRQIYGGIYDPGSALSNDQGFRKDVIEALRELKVPVVRWPGGCFVSSYHWLDGVGSIRNPVYDLAWQVEEPNTFGSDEFVAWCREIGAEPYICTNAGTGTPKEMSDWVEYCNLEEMGRFAKMRIANGYTEPHDVKYWSIGNENYGEWEIGAKTVDEWGYFVRESAKMMLNVDPTIKLFAAATHDPEWTIPLLQKAGSYLDYISIHGYWDRLQEENTPSDYMTCMLRSVVPERRILNAIDILRKTGFENRIKIAFDEWNLRSWHHPGKGDHRQQQDVEARDLNDVNSTYTMADALFSSCFLNACLRYSEYVAMANMAPVVNTRGPLYVYPNGIVKRTTYHVMHMYANLLQPNVLPVHVQSDKLVGSAGRLTQVPMVDAIVTSSNDGKNLAIVLVNRNPESEVECLLGLGNVTSKFEATVLSGDSPDAYNDIDMPDGVVPEKRQFTVRNGTVLLPPHSLVIINVPAKFI